MGLLEKKIQELQSQLTPLLRAPAAAALPGSEPTESTGDIPAKIGFLNNLLAREMEINSENKPEYLNHVAERLAMLEAAFHNWNNHGHGGAPPLDDLLNDDIPTCSCTHSCLIDEQEEEEEVQVEDGNRMDKEEEDDDDDDGEKKGGEIFQKDGSGANKMCFGFDWNSCNDAHQISKKESVLLTNMF
ncbi:hypothetical protein J5N97_029859 [Dioscorea zingiberensis]|uniref:DUF7610 domain-containing protein n=1 Tax=Dioscorea zingiberensis TaxID=325984 RepID=A0A9D5BWH8_9LILI|nr:hypothetical protein J5N97_029859 [Dioscorea zingiberensis]